MESTNQTNDQFQKHIANLVQGERTYKYLVKCEHSWEYLVICSQK